MKKWIFLFLALVLVANFVAMGVGCSKAPETPPKTEEMKPPEAPAPAMPAATPAPATTAAPAK